MRAIDSSRTRNGFRNARANPLSPFLFWNCLDLHSCSCGAPFAHPIFAALAINGTNYAVCLWSSLLSIRMLFVRRCNGIPSTSPIHYTVMLSVALPVVLCIQFDLKQKNIFACSSVWMVFVRMPILIYTLPAVHIVYLDFLANCQSESRTKHH